MAARSRGWDALRSHELAKAAALMAVDVEKIDQLAAALVAFQGDMPAVAKDSENPFFHSKYADMADVVAAAKPHLKAHGLAVSQFVSHDEDRNTLVTYLMHSSGQFIKDEMLLMLPKEDPQGQGSAITYARRYAYSAALGIVTDSDDDGAAASSAPSVKPSPAASKNCPLCDKPLAGNAVVKGDSGYVHKACLEADEAKAAAPSVTETGDKP